MDFSDMAESARYQRMPRLPNSRIADLRPADTLAGATPVPNDTRVAIWRSRLTPEQRVELQARGNKAREPFLPLWREPMRKRS